ncbi:MAG: hypothetical protein SGI89_02430 [bacterium]|nr:hypothetical protein [bacterium]
MNTTIIKDQTASNRKIKRTKFFLFSGAMVFGMTALLKNPLKIFEKGSSPEKSKHTPLSVARHPKSVSRNSKELNG